MIHLQNPPAPPPKDYVRERDFIDENYTHDQVLWITGAELCRNLSLNPDWIAQNATAQRPVGVTTYADLHHSPITRLSRFISFRGASWGEDDAQYQCADLSGCKDLENLAGTFHGWLVLTKSGVNDIETENLHIIQVSPNQKATDFTECAKLHILRGVYPCGVDCHGAGVREIDTNEFIGLQIMGPDRDGIALYVDRCMDLKTLVGEYNGQVQADHSGVETLAYDPTDPDNPEKNLIITGWDNTNKVALSLIGCQSLKRIRRLRAPAKVHLNESAIQRIDMVEVQKKGQGQEKEGYIPEIELINCDQLTHVPRGLVDIGKLVMPSKMRDAIRETYENEDKAKKKLKVPTIEI